MRDFFTIHRATTMIQYIANHEHYSLVLSKVEAVRKTLWIGTADIKDVYIKQGLGIVPFLKQLSDLIRRGGVRTPYPCQRARCKFQDRF
jgi:hypothetical protein